jgi:hypothetical protein
MKFQIASELQRRWVEAPPAGWSAAEEQDLLLPVDRRLLGYRPVADLVLTHHSTHQRLWIELEISRADPVANHTKFASAHLLRPFSRQDAFVSLVSNHITRGRANLAAHTTYLLRQSGLRAFQMPLLGELSADQICAMNQGVRPLSELPTPDLQKMIELTQPVLEQAHVSIYYVTNSLEVCLNVRQWNQDAQCDSSRAVWGLRRVKYLVYDNRTQLFAPSKFCAYSRMRPPEPGAASVDFTPVMTIQAYASVAQDERIFDGTRAWKCLSRIGFKKVPAHEASPVLRQRLQAWKELHADLVHVDGDYCVLLME